MTKKVPYTTEELLAMSGEEAISLGVYQEYTQAGLDAIINNTDPALFPENAQNRPFHIPRCDNNDRVLAHEIEAQMEEQARFRAQKMNDSLDL